MRPHRARASFWRRRRIVWNAPVRFVSMARCHWSSVMRRESVLRGTGVVHEQLDGSRVHVRSRRARCRQRPGREYRLAPQAVSAPAFGRRRVPWHRRRRSNSRARDTVAGFGGRPRRSGRSARSGLARVDVRAVSPIAGRAGPGHSGAESRHETKVAVLQPSVVAASASAVGSTPPTCCRSGRCSRSSGPRRCPAAGGHSMMRMLAWCRTNHATSEGATPARSSVVRAESTTTRTARRKTSWPASSGTARRRRWSPVSPACGCHQRISSRPAAEPSHPRSQARTPGPSSENG